jgi:hypothetical protein
MHSDLEKCDQRHSTHFTVESIDPLGKVTMPGTLCILHPVPGVAVAQFELGRYSNRDLVWNFITTSRIIINIEEVFVKAIRDVHRVIITTKLSLRVRLQYC